MKKIRKSLKITLILLFLLSPVFFAKTTVNGRFVALSGDSVTYTVKIQSNTDSPSDTLGSSTIIFDFDTLSLSFPAMPEENADFNFLNFRGGIYNSSVTRPLPGQVWINIESINTGGGTTVAESPGWTDVVELTFKVLKDTGSAGLTWQTRDINWAIYDVDNAELWSAGNWTNDNSSIQGRVLTPVKDPPAAPVKFNLYQNYPNPFNPSTTIKYSVPSMSQVNIKIFDVTGREVKTLVNDQKPAGTYTARFNASGLASGLYLYRIICGNFTDVKKMMLLK